MEITERSPLHLKLEGSSEWDRTLEVFLGLLAFIPPVRVTFRCEKLVDDHATCQFSCYAAIYRLLLEGDEMVEPLCKSITLEEFLQLEETKPAREYIDGHIIQKPMPQGKHSAIQTELAAIINTALKPQKLGRAFAELRCTFGNRSIVPDIAVFSWQQIPRDQNGKIANAFAIAPNWIIEILSPEQNQTRVTKNIVCSLQYGTEMGWLIDPAEQTIFVYVPDQQLQICDQIDQQLPVPPFAEVLHLSLGTVFECLQL